MQKDTIISLSAGLWTVIIALITFFLFLPNAATPQIQPLFDRPLMIGNETRIVAERNSVLLAKSCQSFLLEGKAENDKSTTVKRAEKISEPDKSLDCGSSATFFYSLPGDLTTFTPGEWKLYSVANVAFLPGKDAPATVKLLPSQSTIYINGFWLVVAGLLLWVVVGALIVWILEEHVLT